MTKLDDEREVLLMACLTEDRTDAEQRALLRVAGRIDARANRDTTTNKRVGPAWRLYREVDVTRVLVDDQRRVFDRKVAQRLEAQALRWEQARCS